MPKPGALLGLPLVAATLCPASVASAGTFDQGGNASERVDGDGFPA